jgi:hypothetical protein
MNQKIPTIAGWDFAHLLGLVAKIATQASRPRMLIA